MTNANQESIYELKSMNSTKLNPQVLGDILVIAEKFPYDLGITYLLAFMVGKYVEKYEFASRFVCLMKSDKIVLPMMGREKRNLTHEIL